MCALSSITYQDDHEREGLQVEWTSEEFTFSSVWRVLFHLKLKASESCVSFRACCWCRNIKALNEAQQSEPAIQFSWMCFSFVFLCRFMGCVDLGIFVPVCMSTHINVYCLYCASACISHCLFLWLNQVRPARQTQWRWRRWQTAQHSWPGAPAETTAAPSPITSSRPELPSLWAGRGLTQVGSAGGWNLIL